MTGLGRRLAVLTATAAVLFSTGCGTEQVVQSERSDVTAAPPPNGNHLPSQTPTLGHHAKARHLKPSEWPAMRDANSGVRFSLPSMSGADLQDYPGPGGGTIHARGYNVNTRDDLTLRVLVADASMRPEYLPLMERATSQWLIGNGVTNIVDAGNARAVTVQGRPAFEYGLLYDQPGGLGRGMMCVTVISMPRHFVIAETFSLLGAQNVLRQGHVTAVQARLMSHLRLA